MKFSRKRIHSSIHLSSRQFRGLRSLGAWDTQKDPSGSLTLWLPSNGRSRRLVVLPRDLPCGSNDGLIKMSSHTAQTSTSFSGLCSYLRSHFAPHLPWFWYLWKETHGPSVLPGKEPSGHEWPPVLTRCGEELWCCQHLLLGHKPFVEVAEGTSFLPQWSQWAPLCWELDNFNHKLSGDS